jgi:hypothetical protein
MADSSDLVLTYTVLANGDVKNDNKLNEALDNGYRVIDVIVTPAAAGQQAATFVTVVLTQEEEWLYKSWGSE